MTFFKTIHIIWFSQSSLKNVLKEIIEKKHAIDTCKNNWKRNGKIFNQVPTTCQFYNRYDGYDDLLMPISPDSTDGIASEIADEKIKSIADFRILLATLEDIKEDIVIGCRKKEDKLKEFEKLQTL